MTIPFHGRVLNLRLICIFELRGKKGESLLCHQFGYTQETKHQCVPNGRSVHSLLNKCVRLSMDKLSKHSLICPFQHMYTGKQ